MRWLQVEGGWYLVHWLQVEGGWHLRVAWTGWGPFQAALVQACCAHCENEQLASVPRHH